MSAILSQLKRCQRVADILLERLIEQHDCGWFDGGCYTLASAVVELVPDTEIFHISRSHNNRDHAVVKACGLDLYFDADGIVNEADMFTKMRTVELTPCNVLAPFNDFDKYQERVFQDIKSAIIEAFQLPVPKDE